MTLAGNVQHFIGVIEEMATECALAILLLLCIWPCMPSASNFLDAGFGVCL